MKLFPMSYRVVFSNGNKCLRCLRKKEKTGKSVGIDLGLKHLVVTSEGRKEENHRYLKTYEKKLKRAQQHLSRKQKGSQAFEKQKRNVAAIHEKIANCRKDRLHKLSHRLIRDYDTIYVEDLHIKGMMKSRKLSKSIADASWGMLVRFLEYKADWYGKEVVKIERFFPSSKTCHVCGKVKDDLKFWEREWSCSNCGTVHDRDVNAARNILQKGKENPSNHRRGPFDYMCGVNR